MNADLANVLRWVMLVIIIIVIGLELVGYIPNWAMGLLLVPATFAFIYFWQLASRSSDRD